MVIPSFHEDSLNLHDLATKVSDICRMEGVTKDTMLSAYQGFLSKMQAQIRKAMLFENVGNLLNVLHKEMAEGGPSYPVVSIPTAVDQYQKYLVGMKEYLDQMKDVSLLPAGKLQDVIEKGNIFTTKLFLGSDELNPITEVPFSNAVETLFYTINCLITQDVVPEDFKVSEIPGVVISLPILSIVQMYDNMATYAIALIRILTGTDEVKDAVPKPQIF